MDISRAFDRVGHDRLIYKVKCIGINDIFLKLITGFLDNRFQRVALNGQTSSWEPVLAGVPQRCFRAAVLPCLHKLLVKISLL